MTARHAPLILLVCAGSLAAGVLWLVAGGDGGRRAGAVELAPEPSALERVPVDEPAPASVLPSVEPRQAPATEPAEVLPQEPAFLGRVVDAQGAPVADARVLALRGRRYAEVLLAPDELLRQRPSGTAEARTGADGRFRLPLALDERDADYRLAVRAGGFAPLDRRLAFRSGAQGLGDLVLERGVRLSGVVRDSTGGAVAGAVLRSLDVVNRLGWPLSSQSGEPLATTDEQGAFRTDQLASGPWRLLVTSERHPDSLQEGETSAPGEVVEGLVFVLPDGLDIQGRVIGPTEALTDVVVGAIPLAADERRSDTRAALPRTARCAADGSFTVGGLESGRTYRVAAWREAQDTTAHPDTDWIEVQGGARGLELVLQVERALVFKVVDAVTGGGLVELEARAGCGFPTPLVGADGRAQRAFSQGRVRFPILLECADKPLDLWLSAPGYEDRIVGDLLLADGQTLDLGILALEPVPTLSVHVVSDASGEAVEGAEVVVVPERALSPDGPWGWSTAAATSLDVAADPPWRRARTDRQGRAQLNGSRSGVVLVRHPDFSPQASLPLDQAGMTPVHGTISVELTLRLLAGGRVAVEVVDERGNPLGSAWVRRTSAASVAPAARADTERTARDGRAVFEHLEAGQHRFEVLPEPGAPPAATPVAGDLTVSEGGEHSLRLVVPAR